MSANLFSSGYIDDFLNTYKALQREISAGRGTPQDIQRANLMRTTAMDNYGMNLGPSQPAAPAQSAIAAPSTSQAAAQASNNAIIANNQNTAQQMINRTAAMPQYAGRTQQFQPNPHLTRGNAPVLPAGGEPQEGMASGGVPRLRRTKGFRTPGGHGLVASRSGGRADKVTTEVPANSFIVPADVVSAIGEGNTLRGEDILTQMFKMGPHEYQPMPGLKGGGKVPVMLSGGEFAIPPDRIAAIGKGDMKAGHETLHRFVKMTRAKNIKTLKKLKPPRK